MFRWVLLLAVIGLVFATADESENPGFFLKITKNVPRIGRRSGSISDFDTFFLKASKSVPRIGRRSQMENWPSPEGSAWKYDHLIRQLRSQTPSSKNYNFVQPFNMKFLFNLLADDPELDESDLKFISWKDFDEALESDTELLMKLIELGREHNAPEWNQNSRLEDDKVVINHLNSGADPRDPMGSIFYRTERSLNTKTKPKEDQH